MALEHAHMYTRMHTHTCTKEIKCKIILNTTRPKQSLCGDTCLSKGSQILPRHPQWWALGSPSNQTQIFSARCTNIHTKFRESVYTYPASRAGPEASESLEWLTTIILGLLELGCGLWSLLLEQVFVHCPVYKPMGSELDRRVSFFLSLPL